MRRDYRIIRGTDLTLTGLVARDRNGTIIDLTGATVKWRVGARNRFSTLKTLDSSDGVTVTDATNGVYSLDLDGADSVNWTPGRLRHVVEVTESGGQIHTVLEGFITLERDLP